MKKETKKKILIVIACILAVVGVLCGIYLPDEPINNTIGEYQNIVKNEIEAIDENIVVEDITENEEESSTENTITEANIEDEKALEEENITEVEGFELQDEENISYDGDRAKTWNVELGDYKGLTYYSQIDSRWKNNLYTATGNRTQTIGSSGCGPTCASMVVSSIKGTITPPQMAELFVQNGYRSANNGTYWSAYRAVADEFNIGYTETSDINRALDLLRNNNYVICSVGNGLFTTGGHYIAIVGIEGNTLKIYDPYNYSGKFDVSSRRGKVEISGNTIYCSIDNFRNYANYKSFFCYQNVNKSSNYSSGRVLVDIPIKIAWRGSAKSYDDSLVDSNGYQFWIKNSVIINNRVYGLADIAFDGGEVDILQIFDRQFWCREIYMSNIPVVSQIQNTVGQVRKLGRSCVIYSNSNLTGSKYNYKANTTITILQNISNTIDKIKVNATGRTGFIDISNYK